MTVLVGLGGATKGAFIAFLLGVAVGYMFRKQIGSLIESPPSPSHFG